MHTIRYGGRPGIKLAFVENADYLVVRTEKRGAIAQTPLSRAARSAIAAYEPVVRFAKAGVEILKSRTPRGARALRDRARRELKKEPAIRFAGRVLVDKASGEPVAYTENFFVKFHDDVSAAKGKKILARQGLAVKRALAYARNAYFVEAKEGTGQKVFGIADRLLAEEDVEFCHPEIVREVRRRAAFPGQWHLKKMTVGGKTIDESANVEAAWALTRGNGVTIAVIDDGVDLDHEEFRSPGKIVSPRDVTYGDPNPRPGSGDDHGTACAGVACADGRFGASGVAPEARLMPIRHVSDLGSQAEADAFEWAADHGADVISCSWGPTDGDWWDPSDPYHGKITPLPDSTRLAIEYALTRGRNGKGCVIAWAAGNGNESVDNDGYASHPRVIAVAACNDSGKRSAYSDFGKAVWCAFPSDDGEPAKTPGIFTTDRSGAPGYNPGQASLGAVDGDYTNDFGGTSSACPGVAGVCALVLARNPELRHDEVKDVLRRACRRIDVAGGKYGASGKSPYYGYGRVDALEAVKLAAPPQPAPVAVHGTAKDVPIRDFKTASLAVPVAATAKLAGVRIAVDIEHTYVGDLVVTLKPPAATGVGGIVLHDRTGGGANDIRKTYDAVSTPALSALAGKSPKGTWKLTVKDAAREDTGTLKRVTLTMT